MRVVSLLPSATELLFALGVEPVGVSHSCDSPPAARDLPVLTATAIDHEGRSAGDIDDQMADAEGPVYRLDVDRLAGLDPDVVVTQATCDVCAVDEDDVRAAVAARALDADVVTLDPSSLGDLLAAVTRVGAAVGRPEAAARLRDSLSTRIATVEEAVPAAPRPRAVVLDWTDPPMVAGHWIPGMVARAGGRYGLASPGDPSRPVEFEAIREYDPGVLVVAPCGFDRDRAVAAVDDLAAHEGFHDLTAVREGRVFALDGQGHVNRPGPRLVDSLAALAACLHPGAVDPPDGVVDRVRPVRP
jgi:iron complex transport system substrate-binding protein